MGMEVDMSTSSKTSEAVRSRLSAFAAELGKMGGQAGRGAAKRRAHCTTEHMRRVRAAARQPQSWEMRTEWASCSVREGRAGWIVEWDSCLLGDTTGVVVLLPYSSECPRDTALASHATPYSTHGLRIVGLARDAYREIRRGVGVPGRLRVLRKGHIVR